MSKMLMYLFARRYWCFGLEKKSKNTLVFIIPFSTHLCNSGEHAVAYSLVVCWNRTKKTTTNAVETAVHSNDSVSHMSQQLCVISAGVRQGGFSGLVVFTAEPRDVSFFANFVPSLIFSFNCSGLLLSLFLIFFISHAHKFILAILWCDIFRLIC